MPGFDLSIGWRFESGVVVQLSWWHLADNRMSAGASILPGDFNVGDQLQNTFLFSPVFNFTNSFAGEAQELGLGNLGAAYGIWNAAQPVELLVPAQGDRSSVDSVSIVGQPLRRRRWRQRPIGRGGGRGHWGPGWLSSRWSCSGRGHPAQGSCAHWCG